MDTHVPSATSADAQAEDWRHSHRPREFADVVGHQEAVRKLLALVAAGRVFHVVLSGPSGVGKTTLARLLAQLLICQAREALEACGVCHSCRSIQAVGSHATYHEINTPGRMGSKDELERFITGRLRFPMRALGSTEHAAAHLVEGSMMEVTRWSASVVRPIVMAIISACAGGSPMQ